MIWEKYGKTGFMSSLGAPVKNGPEVMALLNALQLPGQVAVLKMKAHGKIFTDESKGNDLADRAAMAAAPQAPKLTRKYISDALPMVLCSIRAIHNKTTGLSLFGVVTGRLMSLPGTLDLRKADVHFMSDTMLNYGIQLSNAVGEADRQVKEAWGITPEGGT